MKMTLKKISPWIGALFLTYFLISLKTYSVLSSQLQKGTHWDEEFNAKRDESVAKRQKFDEVWNKKVEAMGRIRKEKQEEFENKKKEKLEAFADFERRFQEKLDRMREADEREKAYPMSQRMQDMADRWDVKAKESWEKDKKETLTRWGWVKDEDSSQDEKKDDF
ncbi:MAG: hypothetical protein KDK96_08960 [Chlamydiia bacterium]|nr:hypothetical protein [Simkania sp.]MCB1073212.1 hypothetical protein [Chlamydiia bacterium]